jgi:hypothetical protein
MSDKLNDFLSELQSHSRPERIEGVARFFQAFPGGYGEGDDFWGVEVPVQRRLSRLYYKSLDLEDMVLLIRDPVHEVRLSALMMLVLRFERSKDGEERDRIARLYLDNLDHVNNWDLVDSSAHYIIGPWLEDKGHGLLLDLARSGQLWPQRVAMISTYHLIRKGDFAPALEVAELLLGHPHDLIHKAVGWMLREIGNRDHRAEYAFLLKHYRTMPRTMLRYAIEKFDEDVRQDFLKGRL